MDWYEKIFRRLSGAKENLYPDTHTHTHTYIYIYKLVVSKY